MIIIVIMATITTTVPVITMTMIIITITIVMAARMIALPTELLCSTAAPTRRARRLPA